MEKGTWFKKSKKKIALILLALPLLALSIFWLYVQLQTYQPEDQLLASIQREEGLTIIEKRAYIILAPKTIDPTQKPMICYPGGLVDPASYLYKMGHTALCLKTRIFIIKAPFNAAIFNINAAKRIIDTYELGKVWVGGHSLGGISASRFVAKSQESISGLFLYGSYSDQDVRDFNGQVISVMGLQDQIINWENYEQAKTNLPLHAILLEIEGLNHSDFGNYGLQKNDGLSSFNDQQIIELICNLFKEGSQ